MTGTAGISVTRLALQPSRPTAVSLAVSLPVWVSNHKSQSFESAPHLCCLQNISPPTPPLRLAFPLAGAALVTCAGTE